MARDGPALHGSRSPPCRRSSDRFGVTGAANVLTPTSTGTVDAFLKLTFYPGRSALRQVTPTYAPAMGIANNPTFSVDLSR